MKYAEYILGQNPEQDLPKEIMEVTKLKTKTELIKEIEGKQIDLYEMQESYSKLSEQKFMAEIIQEVLGDKRLAVTSKFDTYQLRLYQQCLNQLKKIKNDEMTEADGWNELFDMLTNLLVLLTSLSGSQEYINPQEALRYYFKILEIKKRTKTAAKNGSVLGIAANCVGKAAVGGILGGPFGIIGGVAWGAATMLDTAEYVIIVERYWLVFNLLIASYCRYKEISIELNYF